MDITGEFLEISICINQYRLVTPLEKMTPLVLAPIDPLGETKGKVLQDPRKRDVPHLNRQVNMVAHQTIGMDPMAKPLDALLQLKAEASSVSIIEENRLTSIPT